VRYTTRGGPERYHASLDTALAEVGSTANSYQILAKLATGGMAEIYLARSAGVAAVQRHVVLKRVLRDRASDLQFIRMFLDEARLVAQLQHPNIAQVYDVGKLGDSYFFTMEYVHGETVRALLARAHELHRSPPLGCVLAIAAGAAAGLHHAHTRIGIDGRPLDIVHRDVSPSNLMVGYDGSVKLVDFGVAKTADRVQETQSGAVKGKISYLSPEQARGQNVDARSDLFSLGIVLWELLAVDRLYKYDNDFEAMSAIIHSPPPPPSSRRSDIPPELDALVLKALAKQPEDRYQTAEELAEAIEDVAVQTSSALSAASLARFTRELFGNRPEPWVRLSAVHDPEVVTVTSEPIPAELKIPLSDPIDRRLAAVVDLSVVSPVSHIDLAQPTTRLPSVSGEELMTQRAPRRSRLALWLGFAAAIAVGVILALVLRPPEAEQPQAAVAPATPPAPIITSEPIVVADAALEASIDAESEPRPPVAGTAPVRRTTVVKKRPAPPPRPSDDDIVAQCTASSSADWGACALAACRLHKAGKAKRWIDRAASDQRAALVKQCAAIGTPIALDPPPPDCAKNPLACPD
jgi:serine/threonine protein kinase